MSPFEIPSIQSVKNRIRKYLFVSSLVFFLTAIPLRAFVQESKININGYVKELYMFYSPEKPIPGADLDYLATNIIHNRLNLKWYTSSKLTTVIEMRNRLMFGNLVRKFPDYINTVDVDNGLIDLSWISAQSSNWFVHSMIDRAYLDYNSGKWQIRAGRQRVNWGVNLVWNPNDIFNTFSYFDFDYEERPGTDAIRVQYYTGTTSSAELVYKPGRNRARTALAGMYRFSKYDYDFQFIGGQAGNDWIVGGGWSGDIRGAGFRGEVTHFEPRNDQSYRATVASVSADYTFSNGWYIHSAILCNSHGKTGNAGGMDVLFNPDMSPNRQTTVACPLLVIRTGFPPHYAPLFREFFRNCKPIGWIVLYWTSIYLFAPEKFGIDAYWSAILWRCRNRIWRHWANYLRKIEVELLRF